jgi:hypothetical protein
MDELATDEQLAAFADRLAASSNQDLFEIKLPRPEDLDRAHLNPLRVTRAQRKEWNLRLHGPDRKLFNYTVRVPLGVEVKVEGTRFFFEGPLGSNGFDLVKADSKGMAAFKVLIRSRFPLALAVCMIFVSACAYQLYCYWVLAPVGLNFR